jgi:hypothetical protein
VPVRISETPWSPRTRVTESLPQNGHVNTPAVQAFARAGPGRPQWGHDGALEETDARQSGHSTRDMLIDSAITPQA